MKLIPSVRIPKVFSRCLASRGCALLATLSLVGVLATPHVEATIAVVSYTYTATLSGPAESPPNGSPGAGSVVVTYYPATHTLGVGATFSGLTGTTTASHIHAATSVAGTGTAGVATTTPTFAGFPLGVTSGSYTNTLDLTQASSYNPSYVTAHGGTTAGAESALVSALGAGTAYFNIHTLTFPGGEIRDFLTGPAVNFAPTGIALSNNSVAENQSSGTQVGYFTASDLTVSDTFTYALVGGTGDTGNSSFSISNGTNLVTAASFNYEVQNSYSIRVAVTDNGGLSFTNTFTINVTDVNEAPTALALSASSVPENSSVGTTVGTFTPTDPDTGNTYTYGFATGTGDTDNGSFSITGNCLKTATALNYEVKNSYCIRVSVYDGANTFEKKFTINVTDVNESPTDLSLSPSSVLENSPAVTFVGNFTPTDQDIGNTYTYGFATGAGDTDNGSFTINGNCLKTAITFNYEVKSTYYIRVSVYDGVNTFEKALTVTVTDVNEQPTVLSLSPQSVFENQPTGTTVGTLSTTDEDNSHGDTHSYYFDTGTGDTDNGSFSIVGSALKTGAAFDYETKNSYSIRVRSVDSGSLSITNTFTISILDTNEAPTDITLSTNTVFELQTIGTMVGALTTEDVDIVHGDTHTYSLVYHDGCEDNAYFAISTTNLVTASNLLYSARSTFRIVIRTTDSGGLFYDEEFTIFVRPLPGTPPNAKYTNTFASNLNGWNSFPGLELTLDGSGHGLVPAGSPLTPTNAAGNFGGYESGLVAGSGFSTSLDINLDTNTAEGLKFGYLVALNNSAHVATNEFAFLVMRTNINGACAFRINTGSGLPGSFENLDGSADAPVDDANDIVVTNSGWYTFQHWFHQDANTNLVVELTLLDASTNIVATWDITTTLKVPSDAYGNRYAKIIGNEFTSLLVDNSSLTVITKPTALGTGLLTDEDEDVDAWLAGNVFPAGASVRYMVTTAPLHGVVSVTTSNYFTNPKITYTPSADYFGTDSFKYVVNNGAQDSLAATVSITVMSVNDAPSFALSISSVTVAEDSPSTSVTVVNSATVSKGPANESGQIISYTVAQGYDTSLFMTQPTVSSVGTLTFRPAADKSGNTTINIRAVDNGGTACGGNDTSAPHAVLITITPSNDVPVLATIANVTVNEGLTSTADVLVPLTLSDVETPLASMVLGVVLSNQTGGIVVSAAAEYAGTWRVRIPVVAEQSGVVSVHVKATDTGEGASPARSVSRVFTFSVTAVNDAPGFVLASGTVHSAPNVAVSTPGFSTFRANGATPSDTSENAQTGTYVVTVALADKAKFSVQPSISPAGLLTYKFATGASGSFVTTVKVTDNGGTANGGVNVSPTQNLTFSVDP